MQTSKKAAKKKKGQGAMKKEQSLKGRDRHR